MFVYVISAGAWAQKIGITKDLAGRLSSIQTGHHLKLHIVHAMEVPDAARVEERAHRLLKASRLQGEWFKVTPEIAIATVEEAAANIANCTAMPFRLASPPGPLPPLVERPPESDAGWGFRSRQEVQLTQDINAVVYQRLVAPAPREWPKRRLGDAPQ